MDQKFVTVLISIQSPYIVLYFQIHQTLCMSNVHVWGDLIHRTDANWEQRRLKIEVARIWSAEAWNGASGTRRGACCEKCIINLNGSGSLLPLRCRQIMAKMLARLAYEVAYQ